MKSLKSIFIIGKIGVEMGNLSWSIMQLIDCCLYLFLGYSLFGEKIKGNKKNIYEFSFDCNLYIYIRTLYAYNIGIYFTNSSLIYDVTNIYNT